jgi:hypothetical protein
VTAVPGPTLPRERGAGAVLPFLALALVLPGIAGAVAARPVPVPRSSLGINLGQVNYYNTQVAFLDLVKQAPDWGLGSGGQPPPVDAEGWPTSLAPGRAAGFIANVPRAGRYVALYQGDGDLRVDSGGKIGARKPGRIEIDFDGGPAEILIGRTNPDRPLRKLAIVPIAHEKDHAKQVFEPRFLELVQPFGVVRMLDWLRINGSNQERWADRPRPEDFSQGTEKGAALEYALDVCNRVQADCWLQLPHKADDEYVTRFAETVRDRLHPSLRVYVEYSNEIWNFRHGDWCQAAGERLGMKKEWDTRLRYQAHRSLEIFRIFERVLGRERLVRVLAGQTWETRLRILAEWEDAYKQADALAIAPYFCDELASDKGAGELRDLDPGSVAALCVADVARIRDRVRKARVLADRLGLPLVAYEGGQHLATSGALHGDKALQKLLDDANRHPDMGRAYARYYDMWREEGGQLLAVYKLVEQSTRWGRWGLLESMWQPEDAAPKHRATLEFLARQKPWWGAPAGKSP